MKRLKLIACSILGVVLLVYLLPLADLSNRNGTVNPGLVLVGPEGGPEYNWTYCLLAGSDSGWSTYGQYLGIILGDQKIDVLNTKGLIRVGSDELKSCQTTDLLLTDGTSYYDMFVMNKWGHIWFRIRKIE